LITIADVGWGGYKEYEGAFYRGSRTFLLPKNPSENHLVMDVITRTEGGAPDAVNAYDRCIVSVGYFQWCEAAYYLTSRLLGHISDRDPSLLDPLKPVLEASNAVFSRNARGKWRFHFKDARGEVDERPEQEQLFLLRSSGKKGSWDAESKERVKLWTACLANVLAQPGADDIQVEYSAARVKWFATEDARKILWDGTPNKGWVAAMRTGFLSYAGNLPAVADEHLKIGMGKTLAPKWSKDWCVSLFKELTFGPKIAIYPHRYDKIRGPLERNYGIDLPDFAEELMAWRAEFEAESGPRDDGEPDFKRVEEVQQLLSDLGYDLGPAGADGREGPKTRDAIMTFQRLNGLAADGIVGPKTRKAMLGAYREGR
jgi:hypothetical protein